MKKCRTLICVTATVISAFALTACNRQIVDTTWEYDKAIVVLPDGSIIKGDVESWKDFTDGDQIQVKVNGKTYLVHSSNVVLIDE